MNGYVYAIDAVTGALIWSKKVEEHQDVRMTGSPALYEGRLYVPVASFEESVSADPTYQCCTFRGSVLSLNTATGAVVWKAYMVGVPRRIGVNNQGTPMFGPSGGGVWTAPTIDPKRGLIYIGVGNTYSGDDQPMTDAIVALDMKTGKTRWATKGVLGDVFSLACDHIDGCQNGVDHDFGTSPVLARLSNGKEVLFAGQKTGLGLALDAKNGRILWTYRASQGARLGGIKWGTSFDGEKVYFPNSDINAPSAGGLHAVDPVTGRRIWYAAPAPLLCGKRGPGCDPSQSAAITVIPGVVFSGSNDGGIRAYSTQDGSVMWTFDTNRDFATVNGVKAKGASIIGPGPVIAGGMLYTNSGYGYNGGRPGNVLLAFAQD
jgi:polyvinyl alcohol dehydrogenase (cytochrome)